MPTVQLNYAPPPYPDEAVSSWLDRIAGGYMTDRWSLLRYIGLSGDDLDYCISDNAMPLLAHATHQEPERIAALPIRASHPAIAES